MAVRILHTADFHLDSPYASLTEEKARERRREGRDLLMELAALANAEKCRIVLLSGDLFDSSASYYETQETLLKMLSEIKGEVFIAPGNHDYFSSRSPYAFMELPENVHIFRSPQPRYFDIPELGVRVWGAGFTSTVCDSVLSGFRAGKSDLIELMTLHADLTGGRYDPITEDDIAASGLSYLALGHVHTFSGIKKAGSTYYAYPGCPEGRGFDETGPKGVIIGSVGKTSADLSFVPLAKRQYEIRSVDLSGSTDALASVLASVGAGDSMNVVRIVLGGEFSGSIDCEAIERALEGRFYSLQVKDKTIPARGLWDGIDEDSLKGLFLKRIKEGFESAKSDAEREKYLLAARYGVAALEDREGWRP